MKLLLDGNLPRSLLDLLSDAFPGSSHVGALLLSRASDDAVWEYARDEDFAIVTLDTGFADRSLLRGHPPKVILLRPRKTSTAHLRELFARRIAGDAAALQALLDDPDPASGWIEIEG